MFIKGFDQKLVYVLREADISPLGFVVSSNSAQEILCLNTDSLQLVRTTHTKTSFVSRSLKGCSKASRGWQMSDVCLVNFSDGRLLTKEKISDDSTSTTSN